MTSSIFSAVLNSFRPTLIPIGTNLAAMSFPLMKIYPAERCIRRAFEDGLIDSESLVVETSSGTMALSLAIVCNLTSLRLAIVTDKVCDDALKRRLEDLGASVDIVTNPSAAGGYQRARLDRVAEICRQNRNSWWVNQYDNPSNSDSYSAVAQQLIEEFGRVDYLVGSVGSGGSLCGASRYLRCVFPEMTAIGVDTFNSVLFGQEDGSRMLRGLGNSLMPANLDHSALD